MWLESGVWSFLIQKINPFSNNYELYLIAWCVPAERRNKLMNKQQQICFLDEDGMMLCNAIHRNGTLIFSKSGKWFKFFPRKKKK